MSTKYTNLDIKVIPSPPAEEGGELRWRVVIGLCFANAVPKIKGMPRPQRGQAIGQFYEFETEEEANAARAMIEHAYDFILPLAVQYGVLVPVDAEEQARSLIIPGS